MIALGIRRELEPIPLCPSDAVEIRVLHKISVFEIPDQHCLLDMGRGFLQISDRKVTEAMPWL